MTWHIVAAVVHWGLALAFAFANVDASAVMAGAFVVSGGIYMTNAIEGRALDDEARWFYSTAYGTLGTIWWIAGGWPISVLFLGLIALAWVSE